MELNLSKYSSMAYEEWLYSPDSGCPAFSESFLRKIVHICSFSPLRMPLRSFVCLIPPPSPAIVVFTANQESAITIENLLSYTITRITILNL